MKSTNINYLWAEMIVEELSRIGVRMFCVSPGSRNSPLVLAAADNRRVVTRVHPDERGAAFFAVGHGRAHGSPAVLISTSGTAVANYFPAVVEASVSSTPLIILTADRPVESRDTGANQTIDQVRIFGDYVRWAFDLPSPTTEISPHFVLTTIDQGAYRATRSPAGPVHINCPFREPLTPDADGSIPASLMERIEPWIESGAPWTTYPRSRPLPDDEEIVRLGERLSRSRRGVLVCGPMRSRRGLESIHAAAQSLGMPLLADVMSGLRFGKGEKSSLIRHYDLFLRDPDFSGDSRPDFILHLGGTPVSAPLNTYIQNSGAEHVVVNETPFRQDPGHGVTRRIEADPAEICRHLADSGIGTGSDLDPRFRRADAACSNLLRERLDSIDRFDEFSIAQALLENLPPDSGLFLANSMPVRDADACGVVLDRDVAVAVNRGASGIDGTIASASGFSEALDRKVVLLIGDLAFLHDLNSLALAAGSGHPVIIVLVNNDGGGIFSFLPIARHEDHFESHFGAPHGLAFRGIADSFGLGYDKPATWSEWMDRCRSIADIDRSTIIELKTDRRQNFRDHETLWSAVSRALREGSDPV